MQSKFWDKRAIKYNENARVHDAPYQMRMNMLAPLLKPADNVLDLGCASGENALGMAPMVASVHGIDSSQKMIALATENAEVRSINNVQFSQMDALSADMDGQIFSVVTVFYVFHLLADLPGVLSRLHALLSPGGLLISQTPCLGEWNWFLKSGLSLAQIFGAAPRVNSLKMNDLDAFVSTNGFEIEQAVVWNRNEHTRLIVARKA